MMRSKAGGLIILSAILLASVAIKLSANENNPQPDQKRLTRDLTSTLRLIGYAANSGAGDWWDSGLVIAERGDCKVALRDATFFGPEFETITMRRMNNGQPIRYVRDGDYLAAYPKLSIEMAWRLQRELARLGWKRPIAPVIAVGAPKGCWPQSHLLRKLQLHSQ